MRQGVMKFSIKEKTLGTLFDFHLIVLMFRFKVWLWLNKTKSLIDKIASYSDYGRKNGLLTLAFTPIASKN